MKFKLQFEEEKEIYLSFLLAFLIGWMMSYFLISPATLIKRFMGYFI